MLRDTYLNGLTIALMPPAETQEGIFRACIGKYSTKISLYTRVNLDLFKVGAQEDIGSCNEFLQGDIDGCDKCLHDDLLMVTIMVCVS